MTTVVVDVAGRRCHSLQSGACVLPFAFQTLGLGSMNIFFDVDDTLITWDVKLRPDVVDVFRQIRADGHDLYLWSGYGPRWEVVRRFDLHDHVIDCFWKPLQDHHEKLPELGVPFVPDYVVDDHPDIVRVFGGTLVFAAGKPFVEDREMWRVYDEFKAFVAAHRGTKGK